MALMKQALLLIALMTTSVSLTSAQADHDLLMVSCFYQGKGNNCVSIALIKAAMLKFGYRNIFTVAQTGSNYAITLKDGTTFNITEPERQSAIRYAKFITPQLPSLGAERDEILRYAYLAYASIAKFITAKGYWGCEEKVSPHIDFTGTYEDALWFISRTSYCTDHCYRLLGLKARDPRVPNYTGPADCRPRGSILYSGGHAVATYSDHLDCHGSWEPLPIKGQVACSNEFEWYIVLE